MEYSKRNNLEDIIEIFNSKELVPDVNIKGDDNWTSLHYASYSGNFKFVSFLISKNADLDVENNLKQTSLILACQLSFTNIVKILLNEGAYVNAQDFLKNTALHYAFKKG